MQKEVLTGTRGFIIFLVGTVMCIALSLFALYKSQPIDKIVDILYWWLWVAGIYAGKISAEKIMLGRSVDSKSGQL